MTTKLEELKAKEFDSTYEEWYDVMCDALPKLIALVEAGKEWLDARAALDKIHTELVANSEAIFDLSNIELAKRRVFRDLLADFEGEKA